MGSQWCVVILSSLNSLNLNQRASQPTKKTLAYRPKKPNSIIRLLNKTLSRKTLPGPSTSIKKHQITTIPRPSIKRSKIHTSQRIINKNLSQFQHISLRPSNKLISPPINNHSSNRSGFLWAAALTFSRTLQKAEMLDSIRPSKQRKKIWYKPKRILSVCILTLPHFSSVK